MNTRMLSVPLITVDPYFSLWSAADRLYDRPTTHWTGKDTALDGAACIDGVPYRFMGTGDAPAMEQTAMTLTATSTVYSFTAAGVELQLRFTSPLLLSDLDILSRPCSYIDFEVRSTDGQPHTVECTLRADEAFCHNGDAPEPMRGGVIPASGYSCVWMGLRRQAPLSHSGDLVSIDWGYMYLAASAKTPVRFSCTDGARAGLEAVLSLGAIGSQPVQAGLIAAYDDLVSINYFGQPTRGYWARNGKTIFDALKEAVCEHDLLLSACDVFDAALHKRAQTAVSDEYAFLCAASYRQSIAAHKLIADENGDVVFLSKECNSNGCIGTVDVSYPSVPLFLLFNPELVSAMMRPIFRFAALPVWEYDFAPHDVGRYPHVTGQVYGLNKQAVKDSGVGCADTGHADVYLPYYTLPAGLDTYDFNMQMPVEECANMLIMCASVARAQGSAAFSAPHMPVLRRWVSYLLRYGADPDIQLCTDDFAGHLAHNVNLSAKAVMGIASFGLLLGMLGQTRESEDYLHQARTMAKDWEVRADAGERTRLAFDLPDSWSLKYNLVWDLLFDTRLFSETLFARECAWYLRMQNEYGVPLDNRRDYTKSDWIAWCAAFAPAREDAAALVGPVAHFLKNGPAREAFPDWYDTKTGERYHFRNRTVQAGIFMPMLRAADSLR